jgi:hypothetical protein
MVYIHFVFIVHTIIYFLSCQQISPSPHGTVGILLTPAQTPQKPYRDFADTPLFIDQDYRAQAIF